MMLQNGREKFMLCGSMYLFLPAMLFVRNYSLSPEKRGGEKPSRTKEGI